MEGGGCRGRWRISGKVVDDGGRGRISGKVVDDGGRERMSRKVDDVAAREGGGCRGKEEDVLPLPRDPPPSQTSSTFHDILHIPRGEGLQSLISCYDLF